MCLASWSLSSFKINGKHLEKYIYLKKSTLIKVQFFPTGTQTTRSNSHRGAGIRGAVGAAFSTPSIKIVPAPLVLCIYNREQNSCSKNIWNFNMEFLLSPEGGAKVLFSSWTVGLAPRIKYFSFNKTNHSRMKLWTATKNTTVQTPVGETSEKD